MIQCELWQAFNDISFYEPEHRYTDSKNTIYQSATGWIKQFEKEKDWNTIKERKAKKDGISIEELTKLWEYKGKYSTTLGTAIHSVLENLWYKKDFNPNENIFIEFPEMKDDFLFRKERCKQLFTKIKNIYVPIANEFIVYDQPNGICGTIDFLAFDKIHNKFVIIDWKTSKKFEKDNKFGEYLKEPFSHIYACNCSEYSLQLSLYKYILEKYTSIKISEMILFQIPGKEVIVPEVYRCMDFSSQIAKYLNNY